MSSQTTSSRIGRLRLRLQCEDTQARGLQQRSSQLFHLHLHDELEALFARLAPAMAGRTLALEKLVLDLGELPLNGFETSFSERVLAQLEQRLRDLIASLPTMQQAMSSDEERAHEKSLPSLPATAVADRLLQAHAPSIDTSAMAFGSTLVGLPAQADVVDTLLAYLHDGYWPYPTLWRDSPGSWLRRQLRAATADWTPVLLLCCARADSLQRMLTTFDLPSQASLLQAARPGWAPAGSVALGRWQRWQATFRQRDGQGGWPASSMPEQNARSLSTPQPHEQVPSAAQQGSPPHRMQGADTEDASATTRSAQQDAPQDMAVSNAGLVLLWPLLPRLFTRLALVHEQRFIDIHAQARAVCLLDWLLWDIAAPDEEDEDRDPVPLDGLEPEWRTPFTKFLCGWPAQLPLPAWQWPSRQERDDLRLWLRSNLDLWPELKRVGLEGLRELILQREGQLHLQPRTAVLHVRRDACDVLLRGVPWPMREVRLPWMEQVLLVDWLERDGPPFA